MKRAAIVLCLLGAVGCGDDDDLRARIEAAGVYSPTRSESASQEMLDLGQRLFFDPELSGNRNVACASCHQPVDHAGDRLERGAGQGAVGVGSQRTGGLTLPRNTPSPFNRSFSRALLWDGRVEWLDDGTLRAPVPLPPGIGNPLEAQALLPLLDRDEMRGQVGDLDVRGAPNELAAIADDEPEAVWAGVMARLLAIPEYRERFAVAFPGVAAGEHTIVHAVRAIARFEMRLWELTDTDFDAYLGSVHRPPNEGLLRDDARRGALLFFGEAGCSRCHNGPLLSDDLFHNIGVPPRDGVSDQGRAQVTGRDEDRFAFRTPPLRNVGLTSPYFHDGSALGLSEVIEQHIHPQRAWGGLDPATEAALSATLDPDLALARALSQEELWAIESFLVASLTSQTELGVGPEQGVPSTVPSGLPVQGSLVEQPRF